MSLISFCVMSFSCTEFAIQISVSTAACSERGEEVTGSSGTASQTHHARRAPHFDGWVVASGQQELLISGAEGYGVHHVVVLQTGQTDVVMAIPDVAVLVFGTTAAQEKQRKRASTKRELRFIYLFFYVWKSSHFETVCLGVELRSCDVTNEVLMHRPKPVSISPRRISQRFIWQTVFTLVLTTPSHV